MAAILADNEANVTDPTDKHVREYLARLGNNVDMKAGQVIWYSFVPLANCTGVILVKLTTRVGTTRTASVGTTSSLSPLCSSSFRFGSIPPPPPFILLRGRGTFDTARPKGRGGTSFILLVAVALGGRRARTIDIAPLPSPAGRTYALSLSGGQSTSLASGKNGLVAFSWGSCPWEWCRMIAQLRDWSDTRITMIAQLRDMSDT